MKKIILASLAFVLLQSCAQNASKIRANIVNPEKYASLTCQETSDELVLQETKMNRLSDLQNNAVIVDAVSVFFILVPMSVIAGDRSEDLAQQKGEVEALKFAKFENCKDS